MKTCMACKIEKAPDAFYMDASRADGLTQNCQDCSRRNMNAHYRGKQMDAHVSTFVMFLTEAPSVYAIIKAAADNMLGRAGPRNDDDAEWYEAFNVSMCDLMRATLRSLRKQ